MIKCSECGAAQFDGTLFCSECGKELPEESELPTNVLPFSRSSRHAAPPPLSSYQLEPGSEAMMITLVIPGSRDRLTISLVDEILIGRSDPGAGVVPEVDLTDFEGMDKGVSRRHAVLQLSDKGVVLSDLGSTNGTLLNNSRLSPEQPFLLHSGDEVRFGDLLVHVFFEA